MPWSLGSVTAATTNDAWSSPRAIRSATASAPRFNGHLAPNPSRSSRALSSLQLAFARTAHSWHDAAIASIHGRPVASVLLPLLGVPKIGLFTQDGSSPRRSPRFLDAVSTTTRPGVCERLRTPNERVITLEIQDLLNQRFHDLNFLVLIRRGVEQDGTSSDHARCRPVVPADDRFAQPATGPVLLTHQDVRAVVLSRFEEIPRSDLGPGRGAWGVSIGLANQFPGREVVAVERSPTQLEYLQVNRRRFNAWNLRIVPGTAPDAILEEPAPAAVFVGGREASSMRFTTLSFAGWFPKGSSWPTSSASRT